MNTWVVGQLIRKDWRLNRTLIFASIFAGVVSLTIVQLATEATVVLGAVWFFIALILVGCMLPIGIVNERKKQNLAFLMSLPISSIQYATSKLLSSTGMFLIPWLTLVMAALVSLVVRGIFHYYRCCADWRVRGMGNRGERGVQLVIRIGLLLPEPGSRRHGTQRVSRCGVEFDNTEDPGNRAGAHSVAAGGDILCTIPQARFRLTSLEF